MAIKAADIVDPKTIGLNISNENNKYFPFSFRKVVIGVMDFILYIVVKRLFPLPFVAFLILSVKLPLTSHKIVAILNAL